MFSKPLVDLSVSFKAYDVRGLVSKTTTAASVEVMALPLPTR